MYDPLGLISPIVHEGRRIFQEATRLKLSWDEPLPHDVAQRWFALLTSLSHLPEIHFQHCIIPAGFRPSPSYIISATAARSDLEHVLTPVSSAHPGRFT